MSEFSDELNLLKSAGATDEELKKHQRDEAQLLTDSGASEEEIKDYLGIKVSSENNKCPTLVFSCDFNTLTIFCSKSHLQCATSSLNSIKNIKQ